MKLTETGLLKIEYEGINWTELAYTNLQLLNDTLLKVSGMLDVDTTGLADGDILKYSAADGKWKPVRWGAHFSTTTTTTSSSSSSSSSSTTN